MPAVPFSTSAVSFCLPAVALVTSLCLGAAAPGTSALPAPARLGPPLLCHPFVIGDAPSLPFGSGAFAADRSLSSKEVVPQVRQLLAQTDDALVRMETVRRAVIHLAWDEDGARKGRAGELVSILTAAHDRAARTHARWPGDAAARRALALSALDLAYVHGALAESGQALAEPEAIRALATLATVAAPEDGAVHLGAALVACSQAREQRMYAHLDQALAHAADEQGLLARSIVATIGVNLGLRDRAALLARVDREVEAI